MTCAAAAKTHAVAVGKASVWPAPSTRPSPWQATSAHTDRHIYPNKSVAERGINAQRFNAVLDGEYWVSPVVQWMRGCLSIIRVLINILFQ